MVQQGSSRLSFTEQEGPVYVFLRNIKNLSFDLKLCKAYTNGIPVCVCPLGSKHLALLCKQGGIQEWGKCLHLHVWVGGILFN